MLVKLGSRKIAISFIHQMSVVAKGMFLILWWSRLSLCSQRTCEEMRFWRHFHKTRQMRLQERHMESWVSQGAVTDPIPWPAQPSLTHHTPTVTPQACLEATKSWLMTGVPPEESLGPLTFISPHFLLWNICTHDQWGLSETKRKMSPKGQTGAIHVERGCRVTLRGLVWEGGGERCLWADDRVKNATASSRHPQVQGHG